MLKNLSPIALAFAISTHVFISGCSTPEPVNLANNVAQVVGDAHWLTSDIIALDTPSQVNEITLYSTFSDGLEVTHNYTKITAPNPLLTKYPHLNALTMFKLDGTTDVKRLLKSNNQVAFTIDGQTYRVDVQQYGVLDDLYTASSNDADEIMDLGASVLSDYVQFKLWAPTALAVNVLLFDQDKQPLSPKKLAMVEDPATGAWAVQGQPELNLAFYQYEVFLYHPTSQQFETIVTTDPYSLSLSTNSQYSQVIDLSAGVTKPKGWQQQLDPKVDAPEDLILYETHIRDFSAADRSVSSPAYRGKYKAFSETSSHGMKHLSLLKDAGLNTIHLLPTYDISTVDEQHSVAIHLDDPMTKVCTHFPNIVECQTTVNDDTLRQRLASFNPRTGEAQALIEKIRSKDDYNWGYDPFHYTVPEGSYALNPDGVSRIVEFREMVQSLHNKGFRVIMDVVYNHTFASGLAEKSVLDKIVPGYYHRLNIKTGAIEQSTCCDNSATEHAMMAKLMKDSLVVWARDYKIDGFRFDLMGHQPKAAMLESREAVRQVDPDTYFYGEGWNFGEVANNAQFIQASQQELAGTEIGTFTDRLRDAVRGGNFQTNAERLRYDQGIGNGLHVVPNEMQSDDLQRAHYQNSMDIVRLGLAANLSHYRFENSDGKTITGKQVLYGGNPAGYALDPADTINYVSKHDNQSLWDNHQYRLPFDMSSQQRVRIHNQSLSYALLAQGIPFLHMGSELMRSKAFLRDSYDYGDWFNQVDFSYQTNNYDVGLPPAEKDKDNWPIISKILEKNGNKDDVNPEQIAFSAKLFADFIRIRSSSTLFRLRTSEQIQQSVKFLNTGPNHQKGLLVMQINDSETQPIDHQYRSILVVFNNNSTSQTITVPGAKAYTLHPVQQQGVDDVVKQTIIEDDTITAPAFTTVVLVR